MRLHDLNRIGFQLIVIAKAGIKANNACWFFAGHLCNNFFG